MRFSTFHRFLFCFSKSLQGYELQTPMPLLQLANSLLRTPQHYWHLVLLKLQGQQMELQKNQFWEYLKVLNSLPSSRNWRASQSVLWSAVSCSFSSSSSFFWLNSRKSVILINYVWIIKTLSDLVKESLLLQN